MLMGSPLSGVEDAFVACRTSLISFGCFHTGVRYLDLSRAQEPSETLENLLNFSLVVM